MTTELDLNTKANVSGVVGTYDATQSVKRVAVLLRGKSAEGVQFCRSAGPAQGPRVVDGGGEIARLSELQRGKDHGDYAPASDVPSCEFDS